MKYMSNSSLTPFSFSALSDDISAAAAVFSSSFFFYHKKSGHKLTDITVQSVIDRFRDTLMTENFEISISPCQAQSEASLLPRLSAPGFLDRRHSSFSSPPLQAWPLFQLSLSFLSLVSSASLSGPSVLACCGEQRHP